MVGCKCAISQVLSVLPSNSQSFWGLNSISYCFVQSFGTDFVSCTMPFLKYNKNYLVSNIVFSLRLSKTKKAIKCLLDRIDIPCQVRWGRCLILYHKPPNLWLSPDFCQYQLSQHRQPWLSARKSSDFGCWSANTSEATSRQYITTKPASKQSKGAAIKIFRLHCLFQNHPTNNF